MDFRVDVNTWFIFSILFIGALGLFIALYIAIPFYARKKQIERIRKKVYRKDAKYKQREKEKSKLTILSQKESIQSLKTNLNSQIQKILLSDSVEANLMMLFSNFEKIYPDFKTSLKKAYPKITQSELKLCALLRLNLSSKDIGQLLHITHDSVNKARYRLRKKMNLSPEEDIFSHLSEF